MTGVSRTTLVCAAMVMVVSLGVSEANALPVTFSTSGIFTCAGCAGNGTNSVTFLGGMGNALMITFTGLGSTSVNTPTGASLGNFQVFFSGNGIINASGNFTLTVTQTAPTAGSTDFAATYSGSFTASNSGSGGVNFSVTSGTIGTVGYAISTCPPPPLKLVPPASNNGITTVQGQVTGGVPPD